MHEPETGNIKNRPMQRYFIRLSFDGTAYHGWQRQPNGMSVQEKLEQCLSTLTRQETTVTGAGRTDAGVHARMMMAHCDLEGEIDCRQLTYQLNRFLPCDIVVEEIRPVGSDMHARFSAVSRTYYYYVHTSKDPFLRHYSYQINYPLDFEQMNKAAAFLLTANDFKAFCKAGADVKTTLCTVTRAEWKRQSDHSWCFIITANRFLRNMVRAVVGTLIDVGRGKITQEQFREIVAEGTRSDAGESMPGHALFLQQITY